MTLYASDIFCDLQLQIFSVSGFQSLRFVAFANFITAMVFSIVKSKLLVKYVSLTPLMNYLSFVTILH